MADAPVATGYVQADGTWNPDDGAVGRLEAGLTPFKDTSIFAFAQLDKHGPGVGLGVRWDFDL